MKASGCEAGVLSGRGGVVCVGDGVNGSKDDRSPAIGSDHRFLLCAEDIASVVGGEGDGANISCFCSFHVVVIGGDSENIEAWTFERTGFFGLLIVASSSTPSIVPIRWCVSCRELPDELRGETLDLEYSSRFASS